MNNPDLLDLSDRTAVVTGASSGLGAVFAHGLAYAGANVVLAARRTDRLAAVAEGITGVDGRIETVQCDVTDAAQVDALLDRAREMFGGIDVMVNNAGTAGDAGPTPERLPHVLFEETVRVNLLGVWYCCQAAGRRMLADGGGGSIINITSALGIGAQQNYPPAYQATKAAVINLTRALAASWADRGVRVNAIAPGWFPSEMTAPFFGAPPFMDWILSQQPYGRVGDPRELIGPLLFLASDASSYVNGHTLVVDGGMTSTFGAPRAPQEVIELFEQIVPDGLGARILPGAIL
ncbi:MAG: SDR family oxidoreductase [Thermoleophilia bacterium]|nr:SDR family oxidoreductase [Thermoleophilia bacterium]